MQRISLLLFFCYVKLTAGKPEMELIDLLPTHVRENHQLLRSIQEDIQLTTPELIGKYGYPYETYEVITPDDYILTLHRIPYGNKSEPSHNKSVIFLQHGLLSSSADWVVSGPDKGLGYILADSGYDVWMGNARGNTYSRRHKYMSTKNADFWDFSWHEIGIKDLPTMIDYVLEKTKQNKLYYIGHSQGTTAFFVMASEKSEYNNKIRAMFSLAPVAYMSHVTSPLIQIISKAQSFISVLLKMMGLHEFLPSSNLIKFIGKTFCNEDAYSQFLCTNSLFLLCGFNKHNLNATLLPVIMGHTPAGASTRQFLHYGQEVNSGKFRQYDYGIIKNFIKYGSISPPKYDLGKITAPVSLHYSHNDWLASASDVYKLYSQLKNPIGKFSVLDPKFNHLDYLWGINAHKVVYTTVMRLMKRY